MFDWPRARIRVPSLILGAILAGCAAPPPAAPPPPPTVVNVTLQAAADANPGPDGKGAPVTLRVYQLTSAANFNNAEFFPLYKDDAGTLKTDLVKREDFPLTPGQSKTLTLMPADPVMAVGIFAGYRDYRQANWRGAAPVPAHQTTNITVTAGRGGITLKAEPAPPPPPPPPKSGS